MGADMVKQTQKAEEPVAAEEPEQAEAEEKPDAGDQVKPGEPYDKWEAAAVERAKAQVVNELATPDPPTLAEVEAEKAEQAEKED